VDHDCGGGGDIRKAVPVHIAYPASRTSLSYQSRGLEVGYDPHWAVGKQTGLQNSRRGREIPCQINRAWRYEQTMHVDGDHHQWAGVALHAMEVLRNSVNPERHWDTTMTILMAMSQNQKNAEKPCMNDWRGVQHLCLGNEGNHHQYGHRRIPMPLRVHRIP